VTLDGLDALVNAISGAGSDMETVFPRFAVSNLLLSACPQNDPYCYEEANLYHASTTLYTEGGIHHTAGTTVYTPADGVSDNYSTDYISLSASGNIKVQFQGTGIGTSYGVYIVGTSGGNAEVMPISLSGSPPAGLTALNADDYESIHLVITNTTKTSALPRSCPYQSYTIRVGESLGDPPCPAEKLYGENSEESELLRDLRDRVLSTTQEGQEIIRLYYLWSPAIVKAMEEDEKFKEEVKDLTDQLLSLIRAEAE